MMRHLTQEERDILKKMDDPNITKEEEERLRKRLLEIDEEECGNTPFCH